MLGLLEEPLFRVALFYKTLVRKAPAMVVTVARSSNLGRQNEVLTNDLRRGRRASS